MSNLRHYLGIDFEVWDGQQTWFWFVIDPHREGGAIGAAASETSAVCAACLAIDEMIGTRIDTLTAIDWEVSLANLERYLMQCCEQRP
jgi:hypothetical protein